jgi:hypothetical protein
MKSYLAGALMLAASTSAMRLAADAGGDSVGVALRQVTIAGETFEIAAPYEEGHTLNAAEASVLNQTYLENIRNNVAGKIKAAKEAAEKAGTAFSLDTPIGGEGEDAGKTLRQVCNDYAKTYEFGFRATRNAEPVDPVQREARAIAREALLAKLRANGVKRKDVPEEAFEEALAKHAQNPAILKEANRRVKAKADMGLDELDLSAIAGGDQSSGEGDEAEGASTEA